MAFEATRDGYTLSDDPARLQPGVVHAFVTRSYWAEGIDRATVERSMRHSHCFGIYDTAGAQVGGARVLTDYATFAYVLDVFILEAHRGRGLSLWMMQQILAHPDLRGVPRWRLATADAHGLYAKVGFGPLAQPERLMERMDPAWPPRAVTDGASATKEQSA